MGKILNGLEKRGILYRKGRIDFSLVVFVTILVVFGVVMVFSASYYSSLNSNGTPYYYLIRQGIYAISGFVIMIVLSVTDYHFLRKHAWKLAIFELLLLAAVFTPLGITRNGATRWVNVGITLMPGEIAKFVIIILGAAFFSSRMSRARTMGGMFPYVAYTAIVCILIVLQPNLSTAITVFLIAVGIAFVAGMGWKWIALLFGGVGVGFAYLLFFADGYQHDRVATFLDPFANALGEGFQVVQSLLALGTGGLTGLGLGNSVQKNLYLPEPQNDFILAIIGEELGFVGILCLMILFVLTVWRILVIAMRAKDNLGMLLATGVAFAIGIQVIFNVAVVTSSMPATGIALPFISSGGNALWICMGLIGVVLNVSRQQKPSAEPENDVEEITEKEEN